MSPRDQVQPRYPRMTADCIGHPPQKGPSALSPEETLRSIDGVGLSTSYGGERRKQVTAGDDTKQSGNARLIHRDLVAWLIHCDRVARVPREPKQAEVMHIFHRKSNWIFVLGI